MKVLCMKITSQFKMDFSEEEELALLGFALIMDGDGKRRKKENIDFGSVKFIKKRRTRSIF